MVSKQSTNENRRIGALKNKLLRYRNILEIYKEAKAKEPHKTLTRILKEDIQPSYPISRTTFHLVLETPVYKLIKENNFTYDEKEFNKSEDVRIKLKGCSYRISINSREQLIITKTAITESSSDIQIVLRSSNEIEIK